MMSRIQRGYLVTGGLGFIGSAYIRRLVLEGHHDIVCVDSNTYAGDIRRLEEVSDAFELVEADIRSSDIGRIFRDRKPGAVVHFAAETHVTRSESDPSLFLETNVEGTRRVLEAAVSAGIERLLHVSTDEVYGSCDDAPFSEADKEQGVGRATSAYARSKALADDIALSFADRLDVVVVRPTNCFGPWQHPEKAIPRWATRALTGRPLPVWGDGAQTRDWIYVEDACDAISVVLNSGVRGEAYNIAPEEGGTTNFDIAVAVAEAAGLDREAVYLTAYDRPDHDRRYAVEAGKLRRLGWRSSGDFESRLKETVDWYSSHEEWWAPLREDAESLYVDTKPRSS